MSDLGVALKRKFREIQAHVCVALEITQGTDGEGNNLYYLHRPDVGGGVVLLHELPVLHQEDARLIIDHLSAYFIDTLVGAGLFEGYSWSNVTVGEDNLVWQIQTENDPTPTDIRMPEDQLLLWDVQAQVLTIYQPEAG